MPRKPKEGPYAALAVGVLVVLALLGGGAWYGATHLTCRRIDVAGLRHAGRAALLELARVDTGMVLFEMDPRLLEARLARHPWVAAAHVTRLPTGTLSLRVEERVPVALALDAHGAPTRYLDRHGFPMPLVRDAVYDVPLVRGLRVEAGKPVGPDAARALLEALAVADAPAAALVSEVEVKPSGDVWLYTVPAGPRGSLTVRLGRDAFPEKLARLEAFWHQAVLPRPERQFTLVDLRFDSQVVTREADEAPREPAG